MSHHIFESLVDRAVSLDLRHAGKGRRHEKDAEVSATTTSTGMSPMGFALVGEREMKRSKSATEDLFDFRSGTGAHQSIMATILSPNSLHLSNVAPSIKRSKS